MITTIKELFPIPISIHQSDENEYKKIYSEIEDRAMKESYFSLIGNNVGNSPEFGTSHHNTEKLPPGHGSNVIKKQKLFYTEQFIFKCLKNHLEKLDTLKKIDFLRIVASWIAKYTGDKSSLLAHQHAGTYISFVYYHRVDEIQGGELVFHSPNHCLSWFYEECNESQFIKPKSGMLVIFPSFLVHSVNSFDTTENQVRISIAGEMCLSPKYYADI